ncbi:hypothetical protein [Demequina salsinemoris]|uniref:hypothetical protein n=1 Tax=Demequina salsinemoris TaxID=577470 RepID=UPI000782F9A5|nr:hypothetical protein [Demequina salsinemoris]
MSMQQRTVWASLIAFILVGIVYAAVMIPRTIGSSPEAISWVWPMGIAMGSIVVVIIAGVIVSTIGGAISATVRGEEPEFEEGDERDKQIENYGDAKGLSVGSFGALGAIILAMNDVDPFWIAQLLFAVGLLGGIVGAALKLRAYSRGL